MPNGFITLHAQKIRQDVSANAFRVKWMKLKLPGGIMSWFLHHGKKLHYKVFRLQKGFSPALLYESDERRCYQDPNSGRYSLETKTCMIGNHFLTLGDPDTKLSLQLCEGKKVWYEHVTSARNFCTSLRTPQKVGDALVVMSQTKKTETHSFLGYLTAGEWCISTTFAIDMTSSNGDKNGKNSLHSTTKFSENESVLLQLGQKMEPYNRDKAFCVYGYGAYVPDKHKISSCFHVSGDEKNPKIYGTTYEMIDAYKECLQTVTLAGPSYVAPVLETFRRTCHKTRNYKIYHLLVIVSDGQIHDFKAMRAALIDLSEYACSVIFVGLGIDYTQDMKDLEETLEHTVDGDGRKPCRRITTLVRYHSTMSVSPDHFVAKCFEKVPKQAINHMRRQGLVP